MYMAQTISLKQSDYQKLLNRIARLEKLVTNFVQSQTEPTSGSGAWWNWAHKRGVEDKTRGEYYTLKNAEDIEDFFAHLEDDEYVYNKFHNKSQKASK